MFLIGGTFYLKQRLDQLKCCAISLHSSHKVASATFIYFPPYFISLYAFFICVDQEQTAFFIRDLHTNHITANFCKIDDSRHCFSIWNSWQSVIYCFTCKSSAIEMGCDHDQRAFGSEWLSLLSMRQSRVGARMGNYFRSLFFSPQSLGFPDVKV